MADDLPPQLVAAQRAAHAAWAEVEKYQQQVDAVRRGEAELDADRPSWQSAPLRPWNDEENRQFAEVYGRAVATQETVAQAMTDADVKSSFHLTARLHAAARGDA